MDNFKIIYKILKYLENLLDIEIPDYTPISAEMLNISNKRHMSIFKMLTENGYINGVTFLNLSSMETPQIYEFKPEITLKGLEYLQENSLMQKAYKTLKGVKDIIPNI